MGEEFFMNQIKPTKKSPVIPPDVRIALDARIKRHAAKSWAGHYLEINISYRGLFAYISSTRNIEKFELRRSGTKTIVDTTKLCRLKYTGNQKRWLFAFFKYSDEKYEPSYLPGTVSFSGTPEQCFDCAAGVYLQDL